MIVKTTGERKYLISENVDGFFIGVYEIAGFIVQFFKEVFIPPYEFKETIKQCYKIGYKSLFLVSLTSFITGIVFTDHSRPALADFGATSWLPSLIGIAIIKALAPLITSLICAGKVGSQIGAELGSMKVTEQIDAMEVSAINPFRYLVVTRVLATTFMIPLLALYSAFIGLIGAYVDVHTKDLTSFSVFMHDVFLKVGYPDLAAAGIRSLFFGFTIGIVGCYYGFNTAKSTEGVGKAANSSVVLIMFLIFIEEIIIVKLFNAIYVQ